ncbi:hypothetical protein PACTADRAFT_76388 [Pachysolen tannophilus NRRL Y-2460]|uniref:Uncharacterized protein n=1 Tax=Pachysolen tannophilus NRRL Y-2460 TaxID=669874 RepID=A0A1E4TSX4_PACTA|nr:hypothetical protein PACTADRAFT_76388 [Pachysolen tannophilus NRRL Y-2460]
MEFNLTVSATPKTTTILNNQNKSNLVFLKHNLVGLIYTVFFQRLFCPVVPSSSSFIGVDYPKFIGQDDLDRLINDTVDAFIYKLESLFDNNNNNVVNSSSNKKFKKMALPSARSSFSSPFASPSLSSNSAADVSAPVIDIGAGQQQQDFNVNNQTTKTVSGRIVIIFYERSLQTDDEQHFEGAFSSDDNEYINPWESWTFHVKANGTTFQQQQPQQQQAHQYQYAQNVPLSSQSTGGVLINGGGSGIIGNNNNNNNSNNNSTSGNFPLSVGSGVAPIGPISNLHGNNELTQDEIKEIRDEFASNLVEILENADTYKDHIPPITSLDGFPYRLIISVDNGNESYLDPNGLQSNSNGNNNNHYNGNNNNYNNNNNNNNNSNNFNYVSSGEEILNKGYKFIKKILSE